MKTIVVEAKFAYHEPTSVSEAVQLLHRYPGESKVLAGGQSLVLMLQNQILHPRHLVNLSRIRELKELKFDPAGGVRIGAMVTLRELETSPLVCQHFPILQEAVSQVASVHIRNRGTLGGNLCHGLVGNDPPPPLIALGARMIIAGPQGERVVPAEEFFQGFMTTAVGEDEILVGIEVPPQPQDAIGAYIKFCVRAVDPAIVGVAVALRLENGICREARVGLGGAGYTPVRCLGAEATLMGRPFDEAVIRTAGAAAVADVGEYVSDSHADAEYRRRMVPVILKRTIQLALQRRSGK